MSLTCTTAVVPPPVSHSTHPVVAPIDSLLEITRHYGTPTFAYDASQLQAQIGKLKAHLPPSIQVLYSLKANAALGLCSFMANAGLGADVSSAGELLVALEAGFPSERILVSGPDKSPAMLAQLRSAPGALISIDSVTELKLLTRHDQFHRALLRLRPDFCSFAACTAGPDSRFGLLMDDLPRCRELLSTPALKVVGFHIFAGSQVLSPEGIAHHLRGALDQSLRAADLLGLTPEIIDIGGGFGIPYGPDDQELNLGPIAEELHSLLDRAAPARLAIELGRYLVAPAGWYLTTVLAHQQHRGRAAVVVDGGVHQRGDLCGLGLRHKALPPVVLRGSVGARESAGALALPDSVTPPRLRPTDVLGCLSLPSDVLAESSPLPPLAPGDVLAFPNAGAYSLVASPCLFHGQPLPAEVVFEGTRIEVIRARQPIHSILEGQSRLSH
jgi:diaminopimelate decarboxylase